jgi:hypothetical protein
MDEGHVLTGIVIRPTRSTLSSLADRRGLSAACEEQTENGEIS